MDLVKSHHKNKIKKAIESASERVLSVAIPEFLCGVPASLVVGSDVEGVTDEVNKTVDDPGARGVCAEVEDVVGLSCIAEVTMVRDDTVGDAVGVASGSGVGRVGCARGSEPKVDDMTGAAWGVGSSIGESVGWCV
jgi:hypothetical protein